jgi:aspartate-semialdehyde dehydrogenase
MLKVLYERDFPLKNLILLGSAKSAGTEMTFGSRTITVEQVTDGSFKGADIVLSAVSSDLSRMYTPMAVQSGAIVIDNSSAYRMDAGVPLVVPEINPEDAALNKGIIANPNCSTIITLMAVNAINKYSPITRMVASTYQAVSGAGKEGPEELHKQTEDYLAGRALENKVFGHQILNNLIPHIGSFADNGYTDEELKLANESRKILHSPEMKVSCTCVRVPVMRSHSISLMIETREEVSAELAKELLRKAGGVELADDISGGIYPMPLLSSGKDAVLVGRIRKDLDGNGLHLWCCGDQIRKGAATNAVQIAELLAAGRRAASC